MSAYNNEFSVLEQDPQPREPLYHLLVQLLMTPSFYTAKQLFWQLEEDSVNPLMKLSKRELELKNTLFLLLNVLQFNRGLDTADPLWLVTLRQANGLAEAQLYKPVKCPLVYVVRRQVGNPMKLTVVATDKPLYTEQTFPSRDMAEYALYRNQPFVSVNDNYFDNTWYGASAPKLYRRF